MIYCQRYADIFDPRNETVEGHMARWPNGGPKKLYVLVVNATAKVIPFDRRRDRTDWLKAQHPTYPADRYTFLTYEQVVYES